jgi:hypothetical protein
MDIVLVAQHSDGVFVVSLHKRSDPVPDFLLEYYNKDTAVRHALLLCQLYSAEILLSE